MATVSFDRPVTVNPEWGLKNLERALDEAKDLSSMYDEYKPCKRATKAEVKEFLRKYRECNS